MAFEELSGAVLYVDGEYEVTECNDRCQVVFEANRSVIRGSRLADLQERGLFDERTRREWVSAIDAVRSSESERETRAVTMTPSGDEEYAYQLEVASAAADRPGEVCCSIRSVGTDQRYEATLTALHAATRELMAAEDCESVLERTAEAASDVLGFPGTGVRVHNPDEDVLEHVSLGASVEGVETRPPYSVSDSPHGRAFRRGETIIDDIGDDDPFDREVFSQTMYIPIGETGLLSVGTIGREFDETDVQFAEILAENAAAAIRAVETAASLREERERLDLLKQILTRVLRHNIRNDVNVIQANVDLVAERLDDDTEPVDQILDHADGIIDMSEKARQIERIVDSPRSRHRLDLRRLVESTVDRLSRQFPDATIETDVEQCRVRAHETLDLAIENLVENACEHASSPTVSVSTTVKTEQVKLDVVDDGPGIPREEIDVLASGDETELWHGSGLGLWIVTLVVDRSAGEIDFETGDDGTRVSVLLPRSTD